MQVLERVEGFFGKKRPLRYIVVALLLAALGHFLESRTALGWVQQGQLLTRSIGTQLHTVQPFAIADKYRAESRDRRGLWFCATDTEVERASDGIFGELARTAGHADYGRRKEDALPAGKIECKSWLMMGRFAVTTVMATPAVGLAVWREGGWVNRLLLPLTLLGVIALVVSIAQESDSTPLHVVATLAFGPLLMGAIFWLALWVLLALVWAFGNVLAGLTWVIATFAGVYKVGAFCIGILKSSDSIAEQHGLLTPAATPAPTPAPPSP